jgi:hypothetical protein
VKKEALMQTTGAAMTEAQAPKQSWGWAWVGLCLALAAHVADEAATGFLGVYNPTVLRLRSRLGWWPMPTFAFASWLTGLIALVLILLLLSPFAFRNARWARGLAYVLAVIMLLNAIGHTAGTIAGRTVTSVHFARPMPGSYSSPLLAVAAVWLLARLRTTKKSNRAHTE